MKQFEFRVEQRSVAPGRHSWVAVEIGADCAEIPLPYGGMENGAGKNLVGQYPEIEDHLKLVHNIPVHLSYDPRLDKYEGHSDGKSEWLFYRQAAQVAVHDIPRVIWSLSTLP